MSLDNNAVSSSKFGVYYKADGKKLQYYYKIHLSDFNDWSQKSHVKNWLLFGKNLGKYLSLDETSLSNGELYTWSEAQLVQLSWLSRVWARFPTQRKASQ